MSWRERARAIIENGATPEPTKPTKPPFVSFGSATPAPFLPIIEDDALPDPKAEARWQRVLAMLDEQPGIRYALMTDTDAEAVILALAIRGVGTCEVLIPKAKFDPFLLLDLIERHGATVH